MAVRKNFCQPHDLQINARDPKPAVIKTRRDLLRVNVEVEFGPRTLQPDIVEVIPMDAGTPVGIFDTDYFGTGKSLSQRAGDADTRLRICTRIQPANINF